jgi:polypeptide N-acetylgalactosaminyltransferase
MPQIDSSDSVGHSNATSVADPGFMGRPVIITEDNLTFDQKVEYDEGYRKNNFNQYVSDLISVRRPLPDIREKT